MLHSEWFFYFLFAILGAAGEFLFSWLHRHVSRHRVVDGLLSHLADNWQVKANNDGTLVTFWIERKK